MNTHLNLVETTKDFYTGRTLRELHYLRISAVAVPATLLGAVDQNRLRPGRRPSTAGGTGIRR